MPDDNKPADENKLPTPAPEPAIQPLEADPGFQERMRDALGGPPTTPPTFRPVGGPQAGPVAAPASRLPGLAETPRPRARPHNPAFDGPGPSLVEGRQMVAKMQGKLSLLRAALEAHLEPARAALAEVSEHDQASAEAALQKVDMEQVEAFLSFLEDARTIDAE